MKKKHSTLKAFIRKSIILFTFWLIIVIMLVAFCVLKAGSAYDTIKENMLESNPQQLAFFERFIYKQNNVYDGLEGYRWFFDYGDRDWVEENCGGFPRLEKDNIYYIKYYEELTPGEFKGHTGYYTAVKEAYPLKISLGGNSHIHSAVSWIGFGFMLVIVISSIVVYNKSKVDTKTAENVLIKGLSYDLNEPLEKLTASVEAWKQADESEKNALSANVISDVSRMDSVIRRQLRLRDLSAGRVELKTEEIDMHYMVKKVISELLPEFSKIDPYFSKREIDVTDNTEGDDEYIVNADPQLMQFVISNMLLVAADYTEKQIVVQVSIVKNGIRDERVRFMVSSSDRMFRDMVSGAVWSVVTDSDSIRTANFGSKGVGLATLVPILKAHGAKYGKGGNGPEACIWIELKKVEDE